MGPADFNKWQKDVSMGLADFSRPQRDSGTVGRAAPAREKVEMGVDRRGGLP